MIRLRSLWIWGWAPSCKNHISALWSNGTSSKRSDRVLIRSNNIQPQWRYGGVLLRPSTRHLRLIENRCRKLPWRVVCRFSTIQEWVLWKFNTPPLVEKPSVVRISVIKCPIPWVFLSHHWQKSLLAHGMRTKDYHKKSNVLLQIGVFLFCWELGMRISSHKHCCHTRLSIITKMHCDLFVYCDHYQEPSKVSVPIYNYTSSSRAMMISCNWDGFKDNTVSI